MANERWIMKNILAALGRERISVNANQITIPAARETADVAGYEDPAGMKAKGTYENSVTVGGVGTRSTRNFLAELAAEDRAIPVTLFPESDITKSLASQAPIGSPAIFLNASVHSFQPTGTRGAAQTWTAQMEGRSYLFLAGKVLYNNVGGTPLAAGTTTSTPVNLGALVTGKVLGATLHILEPPGLLGTSPSITATLESDVDAVTNTWVTRGTFTVITTTNGLYLELDGDLNNVPADGYWRLKLVITGTSVQATVMAAIGLMPKVA
jgi:hypothetical protein